MRCCDYIGFFVLNTVSYSVLVWVWRGSFMHATDGHLGKLQFVAIVCSNVTSSLIYAFAWLGYQAWKRSAIRHCHSDPRLANPNPSPSSSALQSRLPHSLLSTSSYCGLSGVCTERPYRGYDLHFSGDWCNWVPFHIFIGHFNILFMNCIFKSLSIFSIGLTLCMLHIKHLLNYITFSRWLKYANILAFTLGFHWWLPTAWSFQALEPLSV